MPLPSSSERARILVVDDEIHLAEGIAENLEAEGHRAEIAGDGPTALAWALERGYDLMILDVMLPGLDGFSVCAEARRRGLPTPILFLTAKGGAEDRVHGLEIGGDDYLPKPFKLEELLARVRAILRRALGSAPGGSQADRGHGRRVVRFGGNEFIPAWQTARCWRGETHELTEREAVVLKALVDSAGTVIPREDLVETAWDNEVYPSTRAVESLIRRLRRRFERDPDAPRYIKTVDGVGYRFAAEGDSP